MAAELLPAKPYPPFNRYILLPVCKFLSRMLFWLLGPISVRGAYRVPRNGPLLILSNHLADVDPVVVQVSCPRAVHFMAKSELFEMRLLGKFIRAFQAFPVKRGEPDRASMRHAIDLLKLKEAVCVFPEGQLSEDGNLQELKPGIALIVRQAVASLDAAKSSGTSIPQPLPSRWNRDLRPLAHNPSLQEEGEAAGTSIPQPPSCPMEPGSSTSSARSNAARGRGLAVICCGVRNTNLVMPYGQVRPKISWRNVFAEWGEVREFTRESTTEEIIEWATGQLHELTRAGEDYFQG